MYTLVFALIGSSLTNGQTFDQNPIYVNEISYEQCEQISNMIKLQVKITDKENGTKTEYVVSCGTEI